MKISTKGRYGLRILMDLALADSRKPRLLRDIAKSQQISEKYISRLVIDLRRAHMIRSVRGVNGGFHLAKDPKEITLLDIMETMEGPVSVVNCVYTPEKCARNRNCSVRTVWTDLNENIRALMRDITLEQILEIHRRDNAVGADETFDYCI